MSDIIDKPRTIIGYLAEPRAIFSTDEGGKIPKGLINAVFEEIPNSGGKFAPIDVGERVFVIDGYQDLYARNFNRLVKFEAVPNDRFDPENANMTKFVTFKSNFREFAGNDVFSFIHMKLPKSLDTDAWVPNLPHTKHFFIVDDGFAYGPFRFELESKCRATAEADPTFSGPFNGELLPVVGVDNINSKMTYITKVDYLQLRPTLFSCHGTEYLSDISKLKDVDHSVIQYLTGKDIKRILNALCDKRALSKSVLPQIKKELSTDRRIILNQEGKDLVFEVFERACDDGEWMRLIIDIMNNSSEGKAVIERYIEETKSQYIANWDKEAAKIHTQLNQQIQASQHELAQVKASLADTAQQVSNKQDELATLTEQAVDQSRIEKIIEEKRKELDSQLTVKRAELAELNEVLEGRLKLKTVVSAIEDAQSECDAAIQRKESLQNALSEVQLDLNESEAELQQRLRTLIPYVSSIIQSPVQSDSNAKPFEHVVGLAELDINNVNVAQTTLGNTVNFIANAMSNEYGRSYSNGFISSILVAQAQSMISIFTGAPGLGKTSFARLLKSILKIDDRFLEVPVGRSWVSEREFIGFYNSLSDSFSPAPTGVYQYLKGISDDKVDSSPMSLMLLDEGNLSPIEHYGAFLLNISDDESDKSIQLSKERILVPDTFRVVATVNHDATTEPLSPRLIDRAPVIPFDSFIDDEADCHPIEFNASTLSFSTFMQLFGKDAFLRDEMDVNSSQLPTSLSEIFEFLRDRNPEYGQPIYISRRKEKKIIDYTYTLASVLKVTNKLTDLAALAKACDFAVLYFVLPTIQGAGSALKHRLCELHSQLSNMDLLLSAAKLQDIINRGDQNLETYNFFHY